jgi:serine/threonine protein kinase
MAVLRDSRIIHCDLKPENVLLKNVESGAAGVGGQEWGGLTRPAGHSCTHIAYLSCASFLTLQELAAGSPAAQAPLRLLLQPSCPGLRPKPLCPLVACPSSLLRLQARSKSSTLAAVSVLLSLPYALSGQAVVLAWAPSDGQPATPRIPPP